MNEKNWFTSDEYNQGVYDYLGVGVGVVKVTLNLIRSQVIQITNIYMNTWKIQSGTAITLSV